MPSTDRRLKLKVKDIDGSDRLTAGCVLIDLASPAVSRTAVYANGLKLAVGLRSFFNIILINAFQSRFFGQFNNVLDDCSLYISALLHTSGHGFFHTLLKQCGVTSFQADLISVAFIML
jgi:hypothetical protein